MSEIKIKKAMKCMSRDLDDTYVTQIAAMYEKDGVPRRCYFCDTIERISGKNKKADLIERELIVHGGNVIDLGYIEGCCDFCKHFGIDDFGKWEEFEFTTSINL